MNHGPLSDTIVANFDAMPPQLQTAARYILDQPGDVALLSMREQAKRAGVQPHTMTRLAQRLGLAGYDDIRVLYGNVMRESALTFSGKARTQVADQKIRGDHALAAAVLGSMHQQIGGLNSADILDRLVATATLLAASKRIFCLGLRSCHGVAAQFAYMMSFLGEKVVLLDGFAGTGLDAIRSAGTDDILFAISVAPYTKLTVETAHYAHQRGVPVAALTDSPISPLAALAKTAILVPANGPSFFHTITPAFAVCEILAALIAGRGGDDSLEAIKRAEAQLTAFGVHWPSSKPRKSP